VLICNPDEAGVGRNSTVAVQDIRSEPYESSQYSLVDRVCEFLERYAIEHDSGAEILQSLPSTRAASTKKHLRVTRNRSPRSSPTVNCRKPAHS
jgi:hypothetical protein